MKHSEGYIFNLQRFSVNDGPGIRTTVFFTGCPLSCWWCHNPEGIRKVHAPGLSKSHTVESLLGEIEKDRIFYDESGGGVTFSGGEPLTQSGFLFNILKACRDAGIHTAVDTSGYADKALIKKIMPFTDLFLYDIKLIDPVEHLKYTGISNYEILENLNYLIKSKAGVIIRIPLIPEITMTERNISLTIDHLSKCGALVEVNLLPYHRIADRKYENFGIINKMSPDSVLDENWVTQIRQRFEESGFITKIGG